MLSSSSRRLSRGVLARYMSSSSSVDVASDPYTLADELKKNNQHRAYIVYDSEEKDIKVSHPVLNPLADFLRNDQVDFKEHEGIFLEVGAESNVLMGAFLWRTVRGQGCGGIRFIPYDTLEGYLRDGMRLALGMGRKSALAGLWWGGGKGVAAVPPGFDTSHRESRDKLFRDYGRFVTSLRGCYVAAEDSGVNVDDLDVVFAHTRYATCISPELGGSGNPSIPTAHGVAAAMEGALEFAGTPGLKGKAVAVQGLGNVGLPLAAELVRKGVRKLVASDISPDRVEKAKLELGALAAMSGCELELEVHSEADGYKSSHGPWGVLQASDVDIFSPCAWGGVLSADSVPHIKAKIVCGAANNQLLTPEVNELLQQQGIIYVPDHVANRMGIVNCSLEQYGRVGGPSGPPDPAIQQHFDEGWDNAVVNVTKAVLATANEKGITTGTAADELADAFAAQPHPIWGHRSASIIRSLVDDGWEKGQSTGAKEGV